MASAGGERQERPRGGRAGGHRAPPVGRALRLLVGAALLYAAVAAPGAAASRTWLGVAGWVLGMAVFYLVVHLTLQRAGSRLNPWAGAALAILPVLALFLTGGVRALAVLVFIGVSLVAAAIRADPGCEVMTLPAVLTGRHSRLACLLFSPLDWLEERLRARLARDSSESTGASPRPSGVAGAPPPGAPRDTPAAPEREVDGG